MTRSELKEIITECLYESDIISLDSLVESFDYEIDMLEESLEMEYYQVVSEGTNIDNIKSARKAIKDAKASLKQAKKLLAEENKSGAIKELDDAIDNLLDVKKSVINNQGNTGSKVLSVLFTTLVTFLPMIISLGVNCILTNKRISKAEKAGLLKVAKSKTKLSNYVTSTGTTDSEKALKNIAMHNNIGNGIKIASGIGSLLASFKISNIMKQYREINNLDSANYTNLVIDKFIKSMIESLKKEKEYISKNL